MEAFALELLTRLATTSAQTALLVALVWALCRALPRLPASTQCWLWWTVALQAVVGLVLAPLELAWLPAAPVAQAVAPTSVQVAVAATPLVLPPVSAPRWTLPAWQTLVLALWLAGVAVMALRTFVDWRASRAVLRASRPCQDAALAGALRLASEAHGLPNAPGLRLSAEITSPQLVGVLRPVLLLPAREAARIGDDDLDMALTHELVHLRRRDLWWGLLPALAQHVAFFHPLLHYAVREYGVAREAAVDAAVVAGNRHCRGDYGRLLVRLGVAPRPGAGLASASPSYLSLKRRLLMLQNTHTFPRIGAVLILAGVAVAGVVPLRLVAAAPAQATPAAEAKPAAAPRPTAAPRPAGAADAPDAADDMPAPPALPATPARPAKKAGSFPPPPPAPPAPPAPPKPPAPAPGIKSQTRINVTGNGSGDGYVLLQGDESVMVGSMADLRRAQQLDDGKGVLLVRRDGSRYVIRDAATLARVKALYAETTRIGKAQGDLGERQGDLGEQQGRIGERMGEMGARIGEMAAREAELAAHQADLAVAGLDDQVTKKAMEDARRATEKVRAEMDSPAMRAQIEALAKQQALLGQQQAKLGEQQAAASERAQREADALIKQAIQNGLAQRIDG